MKTGEEEKGVAGRSEEPNVLEKRLKLVLANPYQIKNIPTQKTDQRDSVWIANLLAHGLIKPALCHRSRSGSCGI